MPFDSTYVFVHVFVRPKRHKRYWIDKAAAVHDARFAGIVYRCPRVGVCAKPRLNANAGAGSYGGRRSLLLADASLSSSSSSSFSSSSSSSILEGSDSGGGSSGRSLLGSSSGVDPRCWLLVNYSSDACSVGCAEGSVGPLCGGCEEGWAYSESSGRCFRCGDDAAAYQSALAMGLGLLLAATLWLVRSGDMPVPTMLQKHLGGRKVTIVRVVVVGGVMVGGGGGGGGGSGGGGGDGGSGDFDRDEVYDAGHSFAIVATKLTKPKLWTTG